MRPSVHMPVRAHSSGWDADAVFAGWQEFLAGELVPLYTITLPGHPSFQSTVSDATLHRMRLRIPRTPSPYPEPAPRPWESRGADVAHPRTAREAIVSAGLDYTVVRKPVEPDGSGARSAVVRVDTGVVLGMVRGNDDPVQNRDAFTFFDPIVAEHEAAYETAGVLGSGEGVWILAKLPGYLKIHRNDLVAKYLLLTHTHDGTPVRVKVTPIRLVCNNTLSAAMEAGGDMQISQDSRTTAEAARTIPLCAWSHALFDRLDITFNTMAAARITEAQLQAYVHAVVPDDQEWETGVRTPDIRNDVLQLHDTGRGAELSRGTWWGAFNSVSEYTDHLMEKDPGLRLTSMWFGRGEQLKRRALQLAQQMM